jgi:hypothetical protein
MLTKILAVTAFALLTSSSALAASGGSATPSRGPTSIKMSPAPFLHLLALNRR